MAQLPQGADSCCSWATSPIVSPAMGQIVCRWSRPGPQPPLVDKGTQACRGRPSSLSFPGFREAAAAEPRDRSRTNINVPQLVYQAPDKQVRVPAPVHSRAGSCPPMPIWTPRGLLGTGLGLGGHCPSLASSGAARLPQPRNISHSRGKLGVEKGNKFQLGLLNISNDSEAEPMN